ncbi:2-hydroxychromene-2-carboxylate isomerase [Polaromonas sp. P1(28)-13]|nr:2-hydroxychromene-2-carboxylate isomerase [Polaromonas sp. P1(28)-13]
MTDSSMPARPPQVTLEFWFEFGSNYSYLTVMRIEKAAAAHGVKLIWRPFLLGPIFKSFGWASSPFVLQKEKGAYTWKDMARQCRKYGIPWKHPDAFPRSGVLPMRVALVGAEQPWIGEYCRRVMMLNFAYDQDIDNVQAVSEVLKGMGLPAGDIITEASAEPTKLRLLRADGGRSGQGHLWCAHLFVGDEMFWGNDRLEDALAFAASNALA